MSAANGIHGERRYSPLRRLLANISGAARLLLGPPRTRAQMWPFGWRQSAVAAGVVLAAFLLCMVLIDAAAIRAVAKLPPGVPWFFDQITDYGKSAWFLWPLGILLVALAMLPMSVAPMAQRVLAAVTVRVGFLFLAVAVPGIFINVIKKIFGRARPLVPGTIDPFAFDPFNWSAAWASLPSGHATTVFSVLVAFGSLWPRARTVLWVYALAIVASRVAVTAHFPSDVLAGAMIGSAGALLIRRYFALRRLAFSVGPDGRAHALPGPSFRRIKAVARDLLAP